MQNTGVSCFTADGAEQFWAQPNTEPEVMELKDSLSQQQIDIEKSFLPCLLEPHSQTVCGVNPVDGTKKKEKSDAFIHLSVI